jgi:hypothetical protein
MKNSSTAASGALVFTVRTVGLVGFGLIALALPGRARAQSSIDLPIAQALFEEARTSMNAGRYDEACPRLSESQRLDPATGTLLNLAVCHEKQGKMATAWAEYNDVVAASRTAGNAERQRIAMERIREIEPKLCRISFVSTGAKTQDALVIKLDGVELGPAAMGTAIPVDPGVHEVEVNAKGRKPWSGKVVLTGSGASSVMTVLTPEDDTDASPAVSQVDSPPPPKNNGLNHLAYVAGATGVAALGAGAYFGFRAKAEWDERNAHCPANVCDETAVSASSRARTLAFGADCAIAAGLVSLGVAAYFFLSSGRGSSPASISRPVGFWITQDRAQLTWQGEF